MSRRRLVTALTLAASWSAANYGQPPAPPRFDPLHGSLARHEPQPIYAANPDDPWNQVFFLLFTRQVNARVMTPGATFFAAGDERLTLTDQRIVRTESGDRAIDPLYPSWLWMGSPVFDFEPNSAWRIFTAPRYSRLIEALEQVRRTAGAHPPLARALMQADVWSAHDMVHEMLRVRRGPSTPAVREREQRARDLLPQLAKTMSALSLSAEEIAQLPDTYAATAASLGLPSLFGDSEQWMEIRWLPRRSHDAAVGHRRAARVFVRPADRPADVPVFLDGLRDQQGANLGALDSVALLIQLLLVRHDGTVVPSRITYEAQFRGRAARARGTEIPQYELSRRRLLSSPASGGLVGYEANTPAYLPSAGNDLAFATPSRLDGDPVVAPLSTRCAACHGAGSGIGQLLTFSNSFAPGVPRPRVTRLASGDHVHARDIATRKMGMEDFKSLLQHWK